MPEYIVINGVPRQVPPAVIEADQRAAWVAAPDQVEARLGLRVSETIVPLAPEAPSAGDAPEDEE